MDALLNAANTAKLGIDNNQNDAELIEDFNKLLNIRNMLLSVSEYKDYITRIEVTPMELMTKKTSDIKKIGIIIKYHGGIEVDAYDVLKSDVEAFVRCIMSDEFDGIESVTIEHIEPGVIKDIDGLVLYDDAAVFSLNDCTDDEYAVLYLICKICNCAVSVPTGFSYQKRKRVYVHVCSVTDMVNLEKNMARVACIRTVAIANINLIENAEYSYCMLKGLGSIPYDIPYVHLTESDFDLERLVQIGVLRMNEIGTYEIV